MMRLTDIWILQLLIQVSLVFGAITFDLKKDHKRSNQASVKGYGNTRENFYGSWSTNVTFGSEKEPIELPIYFQQRGINLNSQYFCNYTFDGLFCGYAGRYNYNALSNFLYSYSSSLNATIYRDLVSFEGFETELEFSMTRDAKEYLGFGLINNPPVGISNETFGNRDSFVQTLSKDGVIESSIFSLWTNPSNGSTDGQLVIGAVDMSKVNGSLYKFPFNDGFSASESSGSISIRLASLYAKDYSVNMPVAVDVIPEEQSSLLPKPYLDAILKAYGRRTRKGLIIEQDVLERNDTVIFGFGNFNLSVPLWSMFNYEVEVIIPPYLDQAFREGATKYYLGSDVLRHAYVSVDLDNKEIALGQSLPFTGDLMIVNATSGFDEIAQEGTDDTSLAVHYYSTTIGELYVTYEYVTETTNSTRSRNGGPSYSSSLLSLLSLIAGCLFL